ncbi:hypothetical protein BDQ12DRAFT_713276 [Crucibulum laeve]|uniref:Sc15 protein n=1 Tax=Crucibulum laeve TaxID=68775 RepID=A0A5C3LXD4_9AGAR|nr:hypothetical protein BDQ12DRAFT_713276 [Crucibulum laeve]
MIASRILFSFLTLGVISAAAIPAAVTVEKREDVSDILAVVSTLQGSTGSILPQIDALSTDDSATEDDASALLSQLSAALGTASTSFTNLQGKVNTNSGGSKQDVANAVAPVYNNIAVSLNNFKKHKPHFAPLFIKFGIDAALNKILLGLDILLAGVVKLVAVLLIDVGVILNGLGFTLIFATLGLGGLLGGILGIL